MSQQGQHRYDQHSFSRPDEVAVTHCRLELIASFDEHTLSGTATLDLERHDQTAPLMLDTRALNVKRVRSGRKADAGGWTFRTPYSTTHESDSEHLPEAKWELGGADPILGSALTVHLSSGADRVVIEYSSRPEASGLQWLKPEQTAGKKMPFLFSQNEAIHARSWIPIQDSPGVRMSYQARIRVPHNLKAVMSADQKGEHDGAYEFTMELPIPAYLIALAIGDLGFQATGPRTGVYAEPSMLHAAVSEFADMEKLVAATEGLYGPYRWGRYDLLVLPPSFPFGGMENPRLTFATPTVIAGDKSLVGLVSHELAHSWSGNLVTNATWEDFWLNEGFTTYLENRIQEAVYGREQALMEQVLQGRDLDHELKTYATRDQILHIDLKSRDPEDAMTELPYNKGSLFLRQIEYAVGRPVFDDWLKSYFSHFAFRSITTDQSLQFLQTELLDHHSDKVGQISVKEWVYNPGLPNSTIRASSKRLEAVGAAAKGWISGERTTATLPTQKWSTQEWLEFLQVLPKPLSKARMADLENAFHLTKTGNDEILDEWLLMSIESGYEPAYARLEGFLLQVGRVKYIRRLYTAMIKTEAGRHRAEAIYAKARPGYHPIAQSAVDRVFKPA